MESSWVTYLHRELDHPIVAYLIDKRLSIIVFPIAMLLVMICPCVNWR